MPSLCHFAFNLSKLAHLVFKLAHRPGRGLHTTAYWYKTWIFPISEISIVMFNTITFKVRPSAQIELPLSRGHMNYDAHMETIKEEPEPGPNVCCLNAVALLRRCLKYNQCCFSREIFCLEYLLLLSKRLQIDLYNSGVSLVIWQLQRTIVPLCNLETDPEELCCLGRAE